VALGSILNHTPGLYAGGPDSGEGRTVVRGGTASKQQGRPPVLPVPTVQLSAAWQQALDGYELHSLSAAPRSVRKRPADARIMAKHLTVDGVEHDAVTKAWLTSYFLDQVKRATSLGRLSRSHFSEGGPGRNSARRC
jgi:hypothetical protein